MQFYHLQTIIDFALDGKFKEANKTMPDVTIIREQMFAKINKLITRNEVLAKEANDNNRNMTDESIINKPIGE